jgi:transposase
MTSIAYGLKSETVAESEDYAARGMAFVGYRAVKKSNHSKNRQSAGHEVSSRNPRDRRAIARYSGLAGSPDESGNRRREKGLARAGNARVRRTMIQLAWRFLRFYTNSGLAQWYNRRAADGRSSIRKTMIVALARKLLIVLWRIVTTGVIPSDLKLGRIAT